MSDENVMLTLAHEHYEMRIMLENLLHGGITYNAFQRKHQNFMCSPETEGFVNAIIAAKKKFGAPSLNSEVH